MSPPLIYLITLTVCLQANWYKAEQYCRFHGMHLASINSEQEQRELQEHIQSFGEFLSYISLIVLSGRLIS